jgi:hypothetical protein
MCANTQIRTIFRGVHQQIHNPVIGVPASPLIANPQIFHHGADRMKHLF